MEDLRYTVNLPVSHPPLPSNEAVVQYSRIYGTCFRPSMSSRLWFFFSVADAEITPPEEHMAPCSETYPGAEPFSEFETRFIRQILLNEDRDSDGNFMAFLDIHTAADVGLADSAIV